MVSSPCINVCKMDAKNGLCVGCFRTIAEITAWSRIDDVARNEILAAVAQRRQASDLRTEMARSSGNRHD